MEFLLQYLDDLDDLYGALGLVWEKMRRTLFKLISVAMVFAVLAGGVALALAQPAARIGHIHDALRNTPVPFGDQPVVPMGAHSLKEAN